MSVAKFTKKPVIKTFCAYKCLENLEYWNKYRTFSVHLNIKQFLKISFLAKIIVGVRWVL